MMTLLTLGSEIASQRKNLDMTQIQLALRAGVSRATLAALENGRAGELGYSKVCRILSALGLELRLSEANRDRPTLEELQAESDRV